MIWIICIIGYIIWTIASIWWFLKNMGNKNKKEKWWEKVLLAPVLPIAILIGSLGRISDWRKHDR